jgi:hypothetical protein
MEIVLGRQNRRDVRTQILFDPANVQNVLADLPTVRAAIPDPGD